MQFNFWHFNGCDHWCFRNWTTWKFPCSTLCPLTCCWTTSSTSTLWLVRRESGWCSGRSNILSRWFCTKCLKVKKNEPWLETCDEKTLVLRKIVIHLVVRWVWVEPDGSDWWVVWLNRGGFIESGKSNRWINGWTLWKRSNPTHLSEGGVWVVKGKQGSPPRVPCSATSSLWLKWKDQL